MRKALLSVALITGLFANSLVSSIEKDLVQSIVPNTKIVKVAHTPIDGLYKAYLENGNIIYVYPYKRLIFFGEIYTNSGINLTALDKQRWQNEVAKKQLSKLSVKDLTKYSFIQKFGKGSNRYAFVVFTDPECPFCRRADKFLKNKNVTIYTNLMPLSFHPHARAWSLEILSSKDKQKAFEKIRETNKDLNVRVTKEAKERLKDMQNEAVNLGIRGTPTFFVIDLKTNKVVDTIQGANIYKLKEWLKKDENEKTISK